MPTLRSVLLTSIASGLIAMAPVPAEAGRIDATEGRTYTISKAHGPWMIFVAAFKKPGVDRPDSIEGDEADESVARAAAQDLVLELRKKGIPAYVFELQKERETVVTQNRLGQKQLRKTLADDAQISVLAGNYSSVNSDTAVKTLEWIKWYRPESFGDKARFRVTPGRQGPLAGAFLTINPLLSHEEVAARTIDPEEIKLLKKLNAGNEFPLTDSEGKYSLIVKEFSGRTVMKSKAGINKTWDEQAIIRSGEVLGKAGYDAWQLCASLRNRGVEAYLWHEKYRSIVTVGSFDSEGDPGVRAYRKQFGAEQIRNPQTGIVQTVFKTEPPMQQTPQGRVLPAGTTNYWPLAAEPKLIPVPSLPKSGLFGR